MWIKIAIGAGALLLVGAFFYMLKNRKPKEPAAVPTPIPNYSAITGTTTAGTTTSTTSTTSTGEVVQVPNTKAETIATKEVMQMGTNPAGAITTAVPKLVKA